MSIEIQQSDSLPETHKRPGRKKSELRRVSEQLDPGQWFYVPEEYWDPGNDVDRLHTVRNCLNTINRGYKDNEEPFRVKLKQSTTGHFFIVCEIQVDK